MYLYEEAIVNDINSLFVNNSIKTVIADSLNEALRRSAAENEDVVSLPLIVLSGGDWTINDTNFYAMMHGDIFKSNDELGLNKATNTISITPQYNMYIAASTSRECDMLTREIIFHYFTRPTLTIKIPYGIEQLHTFNLNFSSSVRKDQNASGLVYRTLSFSLEGAYLWHNNTMSKIKLVNTNVDTEIDKDNVSN